jgi:hypothetical protein
MSIVTPTLTPIRGETASIGIKLGKVYVIIIISISISFGSKPEKDL